MAVDDKLASASTLANIFTKIYAGIFDRLSYKYLYKLNEN